MQFTVAMYPEKRFVHIKATGPITPHIFRQALMNSFWNEKFDPTFSQLIDLTDIAGSPSIDETYDVTNVFRVMKNIFKGKIAVLSANPNVYTAAKLISLHASKVNLDFEVFTDIDKAKKWLGVE